MATFLQMKTRIASELQRSDIATQIGECINTAANHYMRYPFWFNQTSATQNTVSGTAGYNWPSDMMQLDSLTITVSGSVYVLRQVSPREIDEMFVSSTETGVPSVFAMYKQQFRLYPTPNGVYTLSQYYTKSYTALSADADTNVWTTEAEELTRTRAKKLICAQVRREWEAVKFYDELENEVFSSLQRQTIADTTTGVMKAW